MTTAGATILAIHPGALGDVVLLGHLLRRLGGQTTLVAGGEKARLLAHLGVAAGAVDFDALPMHEAFTDGPDDCCRLAGMLGLHGRLISCFGEGNARAQQRLAALASGEAAFLPIRPPPGERLHLVRLWMNMLGLDAAAPSPAGGPPDIALVPWPVPAASVAETLELARQAGVDPARPYAVLGAGAGAASKCWPLQRFVALAGQLAPRVQSLMVLGPVEMDLWDAAKRGLVAGSLPLLTCPPLAALAGVLARASLYVGNDSGVTHLAAAVGAPTLALFGPTRAEQFAPLGQRVKIVQAAAMDEILLPAALKACDDLLDT